MLYLEWSNIASSTAITTTLNFPIEDYSEDEEEILDSASPIITVLSEKSLNSIYEYTLVYSNGERDSKINNSKFGREFSGTFSPWVIIFIINLVTDSYNNNNTITKTKQQQHQQHNSQNNQTNNDFYDYRPFKKKKKKHYYNFNN
ncbi:hypothetical protein ACTA71_000841 [Dictyostelium dimigraforme]